MEKKIQALRQDNNMQAVNRRLNTMAEKYKVDDEFEQHKKRIDLISQHQNKVEMSMAKVITSSNAFQEKLDNIYDRQAEVIIGKRNTNCLSCAEEPKNANLIG